MSGISLDLHSHITVVHFPGWMHLSESTCIVMWYPNKSATLLSLYKHCQVQACTSEIFTEVTTSVASTRNICICLCCIPELRLQYLRCALYSNYKKLQWYLLKWIFWKFETGVWNKPLFWWIDVKKAQFYNHTPPASKQTKHYIDQIMWCHLEK